jgi:hypothetical protein
MKGKNISRNFLIVSAALVPAMICLLFIKCYAVNVLFFDEWGMVTFYEKMKTHHLTFVDLFTQNNEHRIFFMRLVYLGIMYLSNYNVIVSMWCSFAVLLLQSFIIVRYIVKRNELSDRKKICFTALVSFLLFSLAQYDNLLWGFQLAFFMVLLFSVLSCYFLSQMFCAVRKTTRNIYFIMMILSTVLASFSSIQGLVTWITGLVLFFVILRRKTFSSPYFIVWTFMTIATWIVYFYGYVNPDHHFAFTLSEHPGMLIHFFSMIGVAVSLKAGSMIIGILLILFLLIAYIKIWTSKQIRSFIFPLALTLNSLFVVGSITIGRIEFGVEQLLESRYTSFTICLVIGVILLWMELKDKTENKKTIKNMTRLLVAILLISIPFTMIRGVRNGIRLKTSRAYSAYVVETASMQPHQFFQNLWLWPDSVRVLEVYLRQQQLNIFHCPQYATPSLLQNNSLGQLNNEVLQLTQNTLQFAPDFISVLRPVVSPQYRNDVKALYADISGQLFPLYYKPEFNDCSPNFASIYDVSAISNHVLSKGVHTLKFKALRQNNAGYYIIDPNLVFEIK